MKSLSGAVPAHHRAGRPAPVVGLAAWLFARSGWTVRGDIPEDAKLVVAVGPHTSNWDFVVAVLAMLALDIRLHFLAKHSLFFPPLGVVMRALGGIPVDRARPEGFAAETIRQIRDADELMLAITPEGTRRKVARLKTGFSRIAADVPCRVLPVLLDFRDREIRLLAPRLAGQPERDAAEMRELFATATPRRPANF